VLHFRHELHGFTRVDHCCQGIALLSRGMEYVLLFILSLMVKGV
jgi:hypothetical protein